MNQPIWTKEQDTVLREMRTQGFSAQQIAVELGGVTRNAVIGRAARLGLASTKRAAAPKAARKPRTRSTPFRMQDTATEPLPIMDQRSDAPVALLDLEPHHCRWPVNDAPYMFCAAAKQDGSSYCGHHDQVASRGVGESRPHRYKDLPSGRLRVGMHD